MNVLKQSHYNILKELTKKELTQTEMSEILKLSKARISQCLNLLKGLDLVSHCETETTAVRKIKYKLKEKQIFSIVVYMTVWEKSIAIYDCTDTSAALLSKAFAVKNSEQELIDELQQCVYELAKQTNISLDQIQSILINTQGRIEQHTGFVDSCNVFDMKRVDLGAKVTERLAIPCKVINCAYAELSVLAQYERIDNAVVIMAGLGCVGCGIVMHGDVLLGANGFYPECSHMPYVYGIEPSLGNVTEHSLDALIFILKNLIPLYNTKNLYLIGEVFAENPELIINIREWMMVSDSHLFSSLNVFMRSVPKAMVRKQIAQIAADFSIEKFVISLPPVSLEQLLKVKKTSPN